jgi:hypothetical protein
LGNVSFNTPGVLSYMKDFFSDHGIVYFTAFDFLKVTIIALR